MYTSLTCLTKSSKNELLDGIFWVAPVYERLRRFTFTFYITGCCMRGRSV